MTGPCEWIDAKIIKIGCQKLYHDNIHSVLLCLCVRILRLNKEYFKGKVKDARDSCFGSIFLFLLFYKLPWRPVFDHCQCKKKRLYIKHLNKYECFVNISSCRTKPANYILLQIFLNTISGHFIRNGNMTIFICAMWNGYLQDQSKNILNIFSKTNTYSCFQTNEWGIFLCKLITLTRLKMGTP